VVVFSQKELRLPKFGKIGLSTIGKFTPCIMYHFSLVALENMLDSTAYSHSMSA